MPIRCDGRTAVVHYGWPGPCLQSLAARRWEAGDGPSPLSRALDRGTGAAGVLVLAGRRPLVLPTAYSQSLVIGLDSALLVLLALTLPMRQALVV